MKKTNNTISHSSHCILHLALPLSLWLFSRAQNRPECFGHICHSSCTPKKLDDP